MKSASCETASFKLHPDVGFPRLLLVWLPSAMLLAKCLVFSCTVLHSQLFLHQMEQFQFVDIGRTAQFLCMSARRIFSGYWFKRTDDEMLVLIKKCSDDNNSKYICTMEQQKLVLEISNVERDDSGLYFCATNIYNYFSFCNGSSLIVGDSYTPSTQVMLLLPPAQPAPKLLQPSQVACMVHGASNWVQVSWDVPGEGQQEGLTRLVKRSSGFFTFVNVLQLPGESSKGGKKFTCKVRFNSSGPRVMRSTIFPASSSVVSDEACLSYVVPMAVVGMLALLMLLLTFFWIRFSPSRLGSQQNANESPSSEVLEEEGICYAQLDFPSRPQDRNKKRRQTAQSRKQKI